MRHEGAVEMLHYSLFGGAVEIDQNIAAKNQVDVLRQQHARVIQKIEPAKDHIGFDLGLYLQLVAIDREIFVSELRLKIAGAVVAVTAGFGVGDGALI